MKFVIEIDCTVATPKGAREIVIEALGSLMGCIPCAEPGQRQPLRDGFGNLAGEARWVADGFS